jgi:predicted Zn-dependent protease
MATGVIAAKQGDTDMAVKTLEGAVAAEDQLRYNEPSDWYIPVRHVLGAVLLAAGRAADAQQVYERDLERNVGNAWALAGLAQSLRAQRKGKQATVAEARALKASKDADVKIAASWP